MTAMLRSHAVTMWRAIPRGIEVLAATVIWTVAVAVILWIVVVALALIAAMVA